MDDEASNIQILPMAEEYIEGYHKCLDAVARERLYLAFVKAPPLASTREFAQSLMAHDAPQYVAVVENEVVGWCDISPYTRDGFTHCGVLGIGVHRNHRARNIGTRLFTATIEKAKERGLERIELEVFGSNKRAMRLFRKVGFVTEGVKKSARKLDGVYDDIVGMALLI